MVKFHNGTFEKFSYILICSIVAYREIQDSQPPSEIMLHKINLYFERDLMPCNILQLNLHSSFLNDCWVIWYRKSQGTPPLWRSSSRSSSFPTLSTPISQRKIYHTTGTPADIVYLALFTNFKIYWTHRVWLKIGKIKSAPKIKAAQRACSNVWKLILVLRINNKVNI